MYLPEILWRSFDGYTETDGMRLRERLVGMGMFFVPVVLLTLVTGVAGRAQTVAPATTPAPEFHMPTAEERAAITAASAAERNREMKLLGIEEMQKPAGAYDVGKPGTANYDESKANPYPKLPELMVMKDGKTVKTAADWAKRRKEIGALYDENVFGKYPAHIPGVTWTVNGVEEVTVAGVPAVVKHVTGHVDSSTYPAITIDIHIDVVTPASTKGKKVPVIIGAASLHPFRFTPRPAAPGQIVHGISMPENPPDAAKLLLEAGWGFVGRNSTDVQADNGAGLDKGIIGLVNHGQPRSVDDWGVMRAWAWADSRILDYLETDADVDGAKVGVMGHSRGGKAALVTLVDDPRFAIAYVSSPGAGADLFRRNYGSTIGNQCSVEEYHWWGANYLRYGAVGHTTNEMPVDAHEFIALAAPRPVFFGNGALITDPAFAPGDGWQDAQGTFMAVAAASPAWKVLGYEGLGTTVFPPMGTLLDSGRVAFRQHQYGHTPTPNWPYFMEFAEKQLGAK